MEIYKTLHVFFFLFGEKSPARMVTVKILGAQNLDCNEVAFVCAPKTLVAMSYKYRIPYPLIYFLSNNCSQYYQKFKQR